MKQYARRQYAVGGRFSGMRLVSRAAAPRPAAPFPAFILALLAALAIWLAVPVWGFGEESVRVQGVRVGIGSRYKVGFWTPLAVELHNSAGGSLPVHVAVSIPDDEGLQATYTAKAAAPPGKSAVELLVRFGHTRGDVTVAVAEVGAPPGRPPLDRQVFRSAARHATGAVPPALLTSQELHIVVGQNLDLQKSNQLNRVPASQQAVVVHAPRLDDLPREWAAYEGVDVVVLAPPATGDFCTHAEPVLQALETWVRMGGRIVLIAGGEAVARLQPGQPLARFVPATCEAAPAALRRTVGLENYAESQAPLLIDTAGISIPVLRNPRGNVEVQEGVHALIVRAPLGFGECVFAGLPLTQPPFANWDGLPQLLNRLLGKPALGLRGDAEQSSGQFSHLGITDLAGHMRSALDLFPGIDPLPFFGAVGILMLLALLIGPLDYLLVHRVARRRGLTWLTFPVVVAAFGCGIWLLGRHGGSGGLRLNQVDLVDFEAEGRQVRGTAWFNVFSPSLAAYDVQTVPALPGVKLDGVRALLAWHGQPGAALGGLERNTALLGGARGGYAFAPAGDALQGLPIQHHASRSFCARWTARAAPPLEIRWQADESGAPRGSVVNTSPLVFRNCLLAYGGWVIAIPELGPGQTRTFDPFSTRRELRGELTGRRMQFSSDKKFETLVEEYDQRSTEPLLVLRQMIFHEASGGYSRARLLHRYQAYTDLSGQLSLSRGVLVGFVDAPALAIEFNGRPLAPEGRDRRLTCVRIVFPVEKMAEAR